MNMSDAPHNRRIEPASIDGNQYERTMGHRPEILAKWFELDETIRFAGTLPPALKEEVRRSLAPGVGCVFCASLGTAAHEHPDARESLAIAYAEMLRQDPNGIDDDTFGVLKQEFSDAEIVELTAWSLFMIAAQAFGAVFKIEPATADEIAAYAQWRHEGEAAAESGRVRTS
jgi:alkylhydroperoxidase family enzyme